MVAKEAIRESEENEKERLGRGRRGSSRRRSRTPSGRYKDAKNKHNGSPRYEDGGGGAENPMTMGGDVREQGEGEAFEILTFQVGTSPC